MTPLNVHMPGLFRHIVTLLLVGIILAGRALTANAEAEFEQSRSEDWRELEPGLELACFTVRTDNSNMGTLRVIRIDPAQHSLVLLSASSPGEKVRPLKDWAADHHLSAAINAGMYQPDGITHTAYLRVGDTINNDHIASRFGAFFVTNPDLSTQLPAAAVLDRSAVDCKTIIPHYEMVIQNFRMISADRRVQWTAEGPAHAISAVGEDSSGRILFLHCSEPMTCTNFAATLLELPIDVHQVMYTEGGNQAGLLLDTGNETHVWAGKHPAGYWPRGGINAPLPNIIGVKSLQ